MHVRAIGPTLSLALILGLLLGPTAGADQEGGPGDAALQGLEWRCVGPARRQPRLRRGHASDRPERVLPRPLLGRRCGRPKTPASTGSRSPTARSTSGRSGAMAVSPSQPGHHLRRHRRAAAARLRDAGATASTSRRTAATTWTHIGLENTRHISRVRVHPTNPDLVYVAAIGNPFGPSQDRGVYRSRDGGKTWEQIFFKHEQAGVIDLVMCDARPERALRVDLRDPPSHLGPEGRRPEQRHLQVHRRRRHLDRNSPATRACPAGDWGRVGLAHSKTMPNRISALIDSKDEERPLPVRGRRRDVDVTSPDDVNITQRPFYYHHLHASPHDGDELWVASNKLWQSLDGGKTWKQRSGTKDDFHDIAVRSERSGAHDRHARRRRHGHAERRQDLVDAVHPAQPADLPHRRRRPVPLQPLRQLPGPDRLQGALGLDLRRHLAGRGHGHRQRRVGRDRAAPRRNRTSSTTWPRAPSRPAAARSSAST